ncbi:MAG: hypothetical protein SFU86_08535 [Pirellulaceae bacterium]|nr:hypothetical protein [Pirellulaceae bacterium]
MTGSAANLTSTEALRSLHAALIAFAEEVRDALVLLELECRRPVEWIDHDRTLYWPRELRKASDVLAEARLTLSRCEATIYGEDHKSCYDERKAVEKAKRRLHLCEDKIQAVRRWRVQIRKEVDEFSVQIAKLGQFLDADFPRSIAAVLRMCEALDRYVEQAGPATSSGGSPSATAAESPTSPENPA